MSTNEAQGSVNEYCRLCASRLPIESLHSFSSTDADSNSLLAAIRRLKPTINKGDQLPQAVCSLCESLLKSTLIFIQQVEHSQILLARMFLKMCAISYDINAASDTIKLEEVHHIASIDPSKLIFVADEISQRSCQVTKLETRTGMLTQCATDESKLQLLVQRSVIDDSFQCSTHLNEKSLDTYRPGTSAVVDVEVITATTVQSTQDTEKSMIDIKKYSEPICSGDWPSSEESYDSTMHRPISDFMELEKNRIEHSDALANTTNFNTEESQGDSANRPAFVEIIMKKEAKDDSVRSKTPKNKRSHRSKIKKCERSTSKTARSSHSRKRKNCDAISTLPLHNGVPTAIEYIELNDPTGHRWSDYYFCKRCDQNFITLQNLRQHWWDVHRRCITFKCTMCTVYILNFKRFFRHLINHQKSLEKCCEFCNKCFMSAADVRYHKTFEHPEENRPHQCGSCGTGFDSIGDLQNHRDDFIVVQAKTAGDRRFRCKDCSQEFLNKITLVTHMETHDPTKNICQYCNKACTSKYTLKEHVFIVHEGQLQYYCQICGKGFKKKSPLRNHLDVHNGIKRFTCGVCDKKFRDKTQLKSHEVTHSSVRPYVCAICDKSYKFQSGLKCHLKTHNNIKPYSCDVCEKSFRNWSNYNKHMKRIHDKDMSKRKKF